MSGETAHLLQAAEPAMRLCAQVGKGPQFLPSLSPSKLGVPSAGGHQPCQPTAPGYQASGCHVLMPTGSAKGLGSVCTGWGGEVLSGEEARTLRPGQSTALLRPKPDCPEGDLSLSDPGAGQQARPDAILGSWTF